MRSQQLINVIYPTTIFLAAACGLVIEIVAGRLLAPVFGMSIYTWTSIIAVVLAGLSIGQWLGGKLTTTFHASDKQLNIIGVAFALSSVSSISILFFISHFQGLTDKNFDVIALILFTSMSLFFFPSLFVGIVSPIITNLAVIISPLKKAGLIIGRMYALGSCGAIFGVLLSGYVLIPTFGTRQTIFTVSITYAILALLYFVLSKQRQDWKVNVTLIILLIGFWYIERNDFNKSPCHKETDYFCIKLQNIGPPGADIKLMALDHLVHSINDKNDARLLHSPYLHFVDELADLQFGNSPAPSSFMIGGGGFTLPRAWIAKYGGDADLYVAEIDPAVTEVARNQMWFDESRSSTTIIHGDARFALRNLEDDLNFNLIFGDAFHDIAIPQHLVTQEFNDLVKSHLANNGIYVVNVVDTSDRPLFLLSFVKTLNKTFSNVQVWFEPYITTETGRVTYSVVASETPIAFGLIVSTYGFERTWWQWPSDKMSTSRIYHELPILTDDHSPVEELMSGILLTKAI